MALVRIENIRKVYHGPRGKTVEAVRDASFSVEAGEIFGLLGPNGAGKTTLLRMLGTIISPTSGCCWIDGLSAAEHPNEVRARIGFLSGNTRLYGRLKVSEILRYFGRLYRMDDKVIARRSEELAEMLDMKSFMDQRCETLSTGQTQKASIARVMLHDPPVLVLDEPTAGLDIMTSQSIIQFIRDAKSRGRAIIFSTHYMTEAEALCDRIALIHKGEILAEGTMAELNRQTNTDNLHDAFIALVDGDSVTPQ